MAGPVVEVEGLKELLREIKAAGPAFAKDLKETNFEVADYIGEKARGMARGQGGVAAKVVSLGAVKAVKSTVGASVALRDQLVGAGGKGATFGAEFGSGRYSQFRRPKKDGYFLYASIEGEQEAIEGLYGDALDRLMKMLSD